jgi:hypothetical protein
MKKNIKKLEADLSAKTSELEGISLEFEQEKKTLKDKLSLTESMLNDSKSFCEKSSKDLLEKDLSITSLNNDKNSLLQELESKNSELLQNSDEISDLKQKIRANQKQLKEKSSEILNLEEKISELQSTSTTIVNNEDLVQAKKEITRLNDDLLKLSQLLDQKEEDCKILKRDKILQQHEIEKLKLSENELKETLGSVKAKVMMTESNLHELEEKNRLGVDRNDEEISKVLQKLKDLLLRQMKPALNHRRLYSGMFDENEFNKESTEELRSNEKKLKQKITENQETIQKLIHENRLLDKYKEEWLQMTSEVTFLKKKLEILESGDSKSPEFQETIEKISFSINESTRSKILNEELNEVLKSNLNHSISLLRSVRMKNVFFKILMIGRIKSYYRFSQWKSATEIPEDIKPEDSDLVSLYTADHPVSLPSFCDPQSLPHLEKLLQTSLINNVFKNQYKKAPMKCDRLPKLTLFKYIYSFFLEKAEKDLKLQRKSSIPYDYLQTIRHQFGTVAVSAKYLSEFLPSLFYLYQEKVPFAILICKLLKYLDPTPVSPSDDFIVLRVMMKMETFLGLLEDFEGRDEMIETLGTVQNSQGFDIIKSVFCDSQVLDVILTGFDTSVSEITGVDFMLGICEGLLKWRNLKTVKILQYCSEDLLNKEKFDQVFQVFKPDSSQDDLEKYFLLAMKESEDYSKVSINGLVTALENAKVDFFSIDFPSEEMKNPEKFLKDQKSMTSESLVMIHKKKIKKKVVKKGFN